MIAELRGRGSSGVLGGIGLEHGVVIFDGIPDKDHQAKLRRIFREIPEDEFTHDRKGSWGSARGEEERGLLSPARFKRLCREYLPRAGYSVTFRDDED
jgi:hypothetical protein